VSFVAEIKSYKDLLVWQRGMGVAKDVYALTKLLPKEELFGLSAQMRRAAVSIPSNIAEGHAKTSAGYSNHLTITMGSLAELETQLLLCCDLYPVTSGPADDALLQLDELNRMLRALQQRLP
jgi:four helix bundle protein